MRLHAKPCRKESGSLPGPFHGAREGSPLTAEPRIARRWFRVLEAAARGCVRRRCIPRGAGGRAEWGHTCVRGPLAARFGPISCRWRAERSANATLSPVFAPAAAPLALEGPPHGPSDETTTLVSKHLTHNTLQITLGAKRGEDYQQRAEY